MRSLTFATAIALGVATPLWAAGDKGTLEKSIQTQDKTEQAAADSQVKIDKLADEADAMLSEFKLTMRQADTLSTYNDHVEKIVASQQEEIEAINAQLAEIDTTNQGVVPLMERMVATLEQFVTLDLPFLEEERRNRVEEIKGLMERADITVSEKYRRILEAYQVEAEYGRTIEAYRAALSGDPKNRTVEFLRVGRLVLLYQTLDQKESGVWDKATGSWQPLTAEYGKSILEGLRIARKQAAPDLIKLPVPAPERVQ